MKVKDLNELKKIKKDMVEELNLRRLGNLHKDQLIDVEIISNGKNDYFKCSEGISKLNDHVHKLGAYNVRFTLNTDPDLEEEYKIKVRAIFEREMNSSTIDSAEVKSFIEEICKLKTTKGNFGTEDSSKVKEV